MPEFSLIPLKNKKPLVKWEEFNERRATAQEIEEWKKKTNQFGIVTGPISGLFVLDIDGPKGFAEARRLGLPFTPWTKTPKGWHYYFRWIPELENKVTTRARFAEELDVRGAGGYVCVYPWKIKPGQAAFAAPPKWLLDKLPNKISINGTVSNKKSFIGEKIDDIKPGNRNQTLTSLAGSLRSRGYKPDAIFDLLHSQAQEVGIGDFELTAICQSVGRYDPKEQYVDEDAECSLTDFLADVEEKPYIVPGYVAENTINVLAGLQESRKSWLLLDMAVSLASGTNWLGKIPCQTRRVLLIDQERPKQEMQRRLKALITGRNLSLKQLDTWLRPIVGTTMRLNLDQSYEKFCRLIEKYKPEVVLIDSLKAIQNGDLTNNQHAQDLFERFKLVRNKYGVTIVILNHETKGAYARTREKLAVTAENILGAGPVAEAPEGLMISVNHDPETSMLHHVKNSYGFKQPPLLFRVADMNGGGTKLEAF